MFDRTIFAAPRTIDVNQRSEVHEHRAPTDESVRLLSEMERAARKRIIERYVSEAGANTLGAVETWEQMDTLTRHLAFKLNGELIEIEISPERGERAMFEELAREIAFRIGHMCVRRRV